MKEAKNIVRLAKDLSHFGLIFLSSWIIVIAANGSAMRSAGFQGNCLSI
jgi:hypothetical protein